MLLKTALQICSRELNKLLFERSLAQEVNVLLPEQIPNSVLEALSMTYLGIHCKPLKPLESISYEDIRVPKKKFNS